MSLFTREQRRRLFALEPVPINGEGECPFQQGGVYILSSRVKIEVTAIRQRGGRDAKWSLGYTIHDRRDKPRKLKRTPRPQDYEAIRDGFDEDGYPTETNAETLAEAAEESSYTSAPTSLSDAGEAVDIRTQRALTKQAHQNAKTQAEINQMRREHYELDQRIIRAMEDARLSGIDISSPLRVMERQLAVIERRVYEGKAA